MTHDASGTDATLAGWLDLGEGFTAHFDCSLEASGAQGLSLVGSAATLTFGAPFRPHRPAATLTLGDRTRTSVPSDPDQVMVEDFARRARAGQPALGA
ncbi:hypothetical protein LAJ19_13935 (plasmid) [Deinococcus taeanensis]|nr:hypothetical protein [Deinococcus taeanensis]UBV44271.1 hypothetical protein LAJ19_13935 [Deinococcus taeanensis]